MDLTKNKILEWLNREEDEFSVEAFRKKYGIDPEGYNLYKTFNDLIEAGTLRRLRRGWYKRVEQIEPIKWWDGEETERIRLLWPQSHGEGEYSSFGFEDNIEVFPGDSIVIAGDSNWGKTAFVLNLLVDNLQLFEGARLMVNEYKPQRFRNRMKKFEWVDFWDDNKPKFELLPIMRDHIDYIKPNYLNIIDWLHIKKDFWDVATQIEEMQMRLRMGILIAVLQKTSGKKMGVGGDWGKFFPSAYFTMSEPGLLAVEKVKSAPSGHARPEHKKYAYNIIDGGSKFHNIREVTTCPTCKGSRYVFGHGCDKCDSKGFIDDT